MEARAGNAEAFLDSGQLVDVFWKKRGNKFLLLLLLIIIIMNQQQ